MAHKYPLVFCTVCISLLLLITSCSSTTTIYKTPVSELRESATRTRVAIATIANEANQANYENLILQAAINSQRFGTEKLEPLIPREYLKVRTDGIKLIEHLAARLLEVIDSEAGAAASANIKTVGEKAKTLADTLGKDENIGKSSVARYAGPVSNLASVVVDIYDNKKREEILREGVNNGVPEAQNIITLLKEDFKPTSLRNVNQTLVEELELQIVERIALYDNHLENEATLTEKEKTQQKRIDARRVLIQGIVDAYDAVNVLNSTSTLEALESLSETLDGLQKVVSSNQAPADFATFTNRLSIFSARSAALLEAAQAVREARKKPKSN